jgi:phosphatidylinositol alpha-1,6-mannosyltransferase
MRICFILQDLNMHFGWGRVMEEIGSRLERGGDTLGFVVEEGGQKENILILPLHSLGVLHFFSFLRTVLAVRRFISSYDIVHAVDVNPNGIIVFFALLGLEKKFVITANATYSLFGKNPLKNFLMRRAYARADCVMVVSEFTKRQIEKGGFRIPRFRIIPPGVDTKKFSRMAGDVPIAIKTPYILGVGAIKERKGYHVSLKAFARFKKTHPDLSYVIIGARQEGLYYEHLLAIAENLGIRTHVFFLDHITDEALISYYKHAEFFVLTPITTESHIEGFGMVYAEAGACGTAVIGNKNTGAEGPIIDGYNGILVPYLDEPALAAAMERLLRDPREAARMGRNGILRAQEFRWEKIVEGYRSVYVSVMRVKN